MLAGHARWSPFPKGSRLMWTYVLNGSFDFVYFTTCDEREIMC